MSLSSNLQCDTAHPQQEQRPCKVQKLVVEICIPNQHPGPVAAPFIITVMVLLLAKPFRYQSDVVLTSFSLLWLML